MANAINGTFSGTGQSQAVTGMRFLIMQNFAGTASTDIEVQAGDGNWIKVPGDGIGIAADSVLVAEFPAPVALRLNCTAYTNDVSYSIAAGGF